MHAHVKGTTPEENTVHKTEAQSASFQASTIEAMPLFYNTDAVEGIAFAYPDTLPQPIDHISTNVHALSGLSSHLTSVERHHCVHYSGDFNVKFLKKKILFPFHSFW